MQTIYIKEDIIKEATENQENKRDLTILEDKTRIKGKFKKGYSGNPKGRPVGSGDSLKTYVRKKFMKMNDKQKERFLKSIKKEFMWEMAEGRPDQHNNLDANFNLGIIQLPRRDNYELDSSTETSAGLIEE